MEIRIVASLKAKTAYAADVAQAVKQVVAPSRAEAGNLQYDLHQAVGEADTFVFFERWQSQDALDEHEKTAHFQRLLAQLEGKTEPMALQLLRVVE